MAGELISDLKEKHKKEWLAIEVLEKDKNGEPMRGELIAHSKDKDEIFELAPPQEDKEIYIVYAGPLIKKGYVAMFGARARALLGLNFLKNLVTTIDLKENKLTINN